MKVVGKIFIALALFSACAPSEESLVEAIHGELDLQGIDEYCDVYISHDNGKTLYVVDTNLVMTEDSFEDCYYIYCVVLGCIGRAIESEDGIARVGYTTVWLDMDMDRAHYCIGVAEREGDVVGAIDRYSTFSDRN